MGSGDVLAVAQYWPIRGDSVPFSIWADIKSLSAWILVTNLSGLIETECRKGKHIKPFWDRSWDGIHVPLIEKRLFFISWRGPMLDLNIVTNLTRQKLNLKALVTSNNGSLILLCSKNIKKDESSLQLLFPAYRVIHLGLNFIFPIFTKINSFSRWYSLDFHTNYGISCFLKLVKLTFLVL